jgi:hypothetical protein
VVFDRDIKIAVVSQVGRTGKETIDALVLAYCNGCWCVKDGLPVSGSEMHTRPKSLETTNFQ